MLQGGRPFTVRHKQNISGSGEFNDRPDRIAGVDLRPSNQGPDSWINPAAFTFQADGTFGNAGRNIARGPTLKNLDLSVVKNFEINESQQMQFRAEFFNLTNHPNFGLPNRNFGTANFGVISSTVTTERQIQFGLRYAF